MIPHHPRLRAVRAMSLAGQQKLAIWLITLGCIGVAIVAGASGAFWVIVPDSLVGVGLSYLVHPWKGR